MIDWQDEFDGTGSPKNWYPFLGYTPVEHSTKNEKGLRWNGKDEDSSEMYAAKTEQHWLNGPQRLWSSWRQVIRPLSRPGILRVHYELDDPHAQQRSEQRLPSR